MVDDWDFLSVPNYKLNMDNVKQFLESSTIHGLAYIATTRRHVRVFWVCAVIAGFSSAFMIILQSFENWSENPVTTTLETLPISDITFPKVTVCPPANTATNLNHDLMNLGNKTWTEVFAEKDPNVAKQIEAYGNNYAKNILQYKVNYGLLYKSIWLDYDLVKKLNFGERDKFRNWYNGYSMEPWWMPFVTNWENRHNIDVYSASGYSSTRQVIATCALSGAINTPGFGDPFDVSIFINPDSTYEYIIIIDYSAIESTTGNDIELHVNIEMNLHRKETLFLCENKLLSQHLDVIITCSNNYNGNCEKRSAADCEKVNSTRDALEVKLIREKFDEDEMNVAMLLNMTGMNVTWSYSHNVTTKALYRSKNEEFVKMSNFIAEYEPKYTLWEKMTNYKIYKFMRDMGVYFAKYEIDFHRLLNITHTKRSDNITDKDLKTAGDFYIYFLTEPLLLWGRASYFFYKSLDNDSPRQSLLLTANYNPYNNFHETVKRTLLEILSDSLGLQFLHLDNTTSFERIFSNSSTGKLMMI